MKWRPLSKRGVADPRLDEPAEGIPTWIRRPVFGWVIGLLVEPDPIGLAPPRVDGGLLDDMTIKLRFDRPLNMSTGTRTAAVDDLLNRMNADTDFALDVIDYLLGHLERAAKGGASPHQLAAELNAKLADGGSAWEVVELGHGAFSLARRSIGPVREAIADLPASSRAQMHISDAWNRLMGRSPDASGAYREAVRAVEAAAKPVILPDSPRATLGTMIAAMRDKPEKWEVTLGNVDEVRQMIELVWTNQLDRHGTDDDSVPLSVTREEADVAVHVCLTLARLFAGGHVRRAN